MAGQPGLIWADVGSMPTPGLMSLFEKEIMAKLVEAGYRAEDVDRVYTTARWRLLDGMTLSEAYSNGIPFERISAAVQAFADGAYI